jgi:hypothetical protein
VFQDAEAAPTRRWGQALPADHLAGDAVASGDCTTGEPPPPAGEEGQRPA